MTTATRTKPQPARPWHRYRHEPGWRVLVPGWAGTLGDDELAFIVQHLQYDDSLRRWWGMRPSWRRIPEEVVKRIALDGDPDDQGHNRQLARPRQQSRALA